MSDNPSFWLADWIWGAPLVVLTVLAHAFVLFATRHRIVVALARYYGRGPLNVPFAAIIAGTVFVVMTLHASEAALWAVVYVMLGALPNYKSAMLYSLEAMTTYGHAEIGLKAQWRMMGAVEALNGLVLFGLTTAFLFSVIQAAVQIREKGKD